MGYGSSYKIFVVGDLIFTIKACTLSSFWWSTMRKAAIQNIKGYLRQSHPWGNLFGQRTAVVFYHCRFLETSRTNHGSVWNRFYRYILYLLLLILYRHWSLGEKFLRINNVHILIMRNIFGFIGLSFWFLTIAHVDINLATALVNTMQIFITILSILIGTEAVGQRRIITVLCGFGGLLSYCCL